MNLSPGSRPLPDARGGTLSRPGLRLIKEIIRYGRVGMPAEWVEPAKLFIELTKVGVAVGAGAWAYHRFVRERPHAPQIEFDVDCSLLGPQAGAYVAEFTLNFLNKGLTRQEVNDIRLRVRGIKRGHGLTYWPSREPRLYFPEKIFLEKNIIPERFTYM